MVWILTQQESIPVGCVLSTCWPYVWWLPPGVSNGGEWVPTLPWTYSPLDIWTNPLPWTLVPEIPPSPNSMTDRRLWKHYLPATTIAGSNESRFPEYLKNKAEAIGLCTELVSSPIAFWCFEERELSQIMICTLGITYIYLIDVFYFQNNRYFVVIGKVK